MSRFGDTREISIWALYKIWAVSIGMYKIRYALEHSIIILNTKFPITGFVVLKIKNMLTEAPHNSFYILCAKEHNIKSDFLLQSSQRL